MTTWTQDEIAALPVMWTDPDLTVAMIGQRLNRTQGAVWLMVQRLELGPKPHRVRKHTPASAVWTEERLAQLLGLHQEGRSASQIGKVLGCTRNAVIGIIHRHGWRYERPAKPAKAATTPRAYTRSPRQPAAPRAAKPKLVTDENSVLFERVAPRPPWTKPKEAAFDVATAPHARPWLQRTGHQCSWPLDGPDGETWSCCAPAEGRTYCADHRAIATTPFKPWKPKARLAA